MLRAVPAIMDIAASRVAAFRSLILISAISLTWDFLIEATLSLLEFADAVVIPQAFLISTGAGGVLVTKEKLLS